MLLLLQLGGHHWQLGPVAQWRLVVGVAGIDLVKLRTSTSPAEKDVHETDDEGKSDEPSHYTTCDGPN